MPGPPPYFNPFGPGPHNATFRAIDFESPPASDRRPREQRPKKPRGPIGAQVLAWTVGVTGYGGLLVAAHRSPYADDLHALAIVWLIVFGALNAHLILKHR